MNQTKLEKEAREWAESRGFVIQGRKFIVGPGRYVVKAYLAGASERQKKLEAVKISVEQLCKDLNSAHDEILKLQGVTKTQNYDWPEWTPQANSIRWAEKFLGKKLAKTNAWTLFPDAILSAQEPSEKER